MEREIRNCVPYIVLGNTSEHTVRLLYSGSAILMLFLKWLASLSDEYSLIVQFDIVNI